jgi:hypothetical protein
LLGLSEELELWVTLGLADTKELIVAVCGDVFEAVLLGVRTLEGLSEAQVEGVGVKSTVRLPVAQVEGVPVTDAEGVYD